jgi:hypothetical protein
MLVLEGSTNTYDLTTDRRDAAVVLIDLAPTAVPTRT